MIDRFATSLFNGTVPATGATDLGLTVALAVGTSLPEIRDLTFFSIGL